MNVRSFAVAVVIATALFTGPARAEDVLAGLPPPQQAAQPAPGAAGYGWNTRYALMFQLQNVFSDGNGILNEYAGGVGAQLNLAPDRAIRLSVSLARATDPEYERTTQTEGYPAEEEKVVPPITSSTAATVRGSYLFRLSQSSISPYVGAGASVWFGSDRRDGTDTTSGTIVYDNTARRYGLGLIGQLGLEWRVHKAVALFAEYGLEVALLDRISEDDKVTYNGVDTTYESTRTRTLNFATGLEQGGELGLVAFF